MNKGLKHIFRSRFVRLALPFLTVVVGGSFFLQQFTQLRYTYNRKTKVITEEEAKKLEYKKDESSLEDHLEVVLEKDLYKEDEWENIRGPRAWEGQEKVDALKEKMKEVKEKRGQTA